jgi:transposase InsO family protein
MSFSHILSSKPSSLLALICLCIIRRVRPGWAAVTIREAAQAEGESAERVSRLATRALCLFEPLVSKLTRSGRPRKEQRKQEDELALTRSLMDVASSILEHVPLRKTAMRALIVGAYLRLRETHPTLTQKRFCAALSLPERTLRSWLKKPCMSEKRSSPLKNDTPPPPRTRPPRRGRFSFAVTLPGTQVATDTTELKAFGMSLKLVATQDIGGRDQSLLDTVIVADHESADIVVAALQEALTDRSGAQVICDQGTPYLAAKVRSALEELEVEHAIQREGDPLGKAPIERAFGTVQHIIAPLLRLTDQLVEVLPSLVQPKLAVAMVTLLVTVLLRAYQAGARASHRASVERRTNNDHLMRVAEQSRQRARAHDRSVRLSLERIHETYGFDLELSVRAFVRRFKHVPLTALEAAERAFAAQAHRSDIRNRCNYFGAIVYRARAEYSKKRARERRENELVEHTALNDRRVQAERAAWHKEPATWLHDALELLAARWTGTELLFGDRGISTWLRQARTRLTDLHGPQASDVVAGVFHSFERKYLPELGRAGVAAVGTVLHRHFASMEAPEHESSQAARLTAILLSAGSMPRPSPSLDSC